MTVAFGVDIGGSGIKGARVDVDSGALAQDRFKILTPQPPKVSATIDVVRELVEAAGWSRSFGCTFPGIVQHGRLLSAANLGDAWVGLDLEHELEGQLGVPVAVLNDADAAGLAEMRFGAGKGRDGTVILTTLGTGIGTAIFVDGRLLPNTELGHLEIDGKIAESRASSAVKTRKGLSYEEYAARLQRYYRHLEFLFSPDLIIVGGGISRKHDRFLPLLKLRTEIVPAALENQAGIVGAAMAARERFGADATEPDVAPAEESTPLG
jgi:polyphosphate glucokinase